MTGGTGLIGSALCAALMDAGHQVTVFSRKPAGVTKKWSGAVAAVSRLDEWHEQLDFDVIINLAGEPIVDAAWTESRKKALWDSRVTFTGNLVRHIAARQRRPGLLLSGSAIGYYGDRGDEALNDLSGPGNDFAAQLCLAWEQEASRAADAGVRVCLLRTGLVLSANGGLLKRMVLPFKLGLGARLGSGRQWMSWIHIDDYVAIVMQLMADANAQGAFNMTAPQPETNRAFTATLAGVLSRPAWLVAPSFLLTWVMGARAILLTGGQKVLPARLQSGGFQFRYERLDDALRACCKRR